jgi:phosphocarrier protein HPr
MLEREVTILNRLGLHARPAAEFVRAARSYKCTVTILKNDDTYSASSILDVLSANLDCGSLMVLRAEGPDAETALDHLTQLLWDFRVQEEGE